MQGAPNSTVNVEPECHLRTKRPAAPGIHLECQCYDSSGCKNPASRSTQFTRNVGNAEASPPEQIGLFQDALLGVYKKTLKFEIAIDISNGGFYSQSSFM